MQTALTHSSIGPVSRVPVAGDDSGDGDENCGGIDIRCRKAATGVNPVPTHRLWGAALTLILVIAVINVGARVIAKIYAPKKS